MNEQHNLDGRGEALKKASEKLNTGAEFILLTVNGTKVDAVMDISLSSLALAYKMVDKIGQDQAVKMMQGLVDTLDTSFPSDKIPPEIRKRL